MIPGYRVSKRQKWSQPQDVGVQFYANTRENALSTTLPQKLSTMVDKGVDNTIFAGTRERRIEGNAERDAGWVKQNSCPENTIKIYEQVFATAAVFVYTGIVPNECLRRRQLCCVLRKTHARNCDILEHRTYLIAAPVRMPRSWRYRFRQPDSSRRAYNERDSS